MSNILEAIKHRVPRVNKSWAEMREGDIQWLVAEVERLYQNQLDRNMMELEMEGEIESLTKERDELKKLDTVSKHLEFFNGKTLTEFVQEYQKLESENAEFEKYKEDMWEDFKSQMDKLTAELATSEKARKDAEDKLKRLWDADGINLTGIRCTSCGVVFPNKHVHPCPL